MSNKNWWILEIFMCSIGIFYFDYFLIKGIILGIMIASFVPNINNIIKNQKTILNELDRINRKL